MLIRTGLAYILLAQSSVTTLVWFPPSGQLQGREAVWECRGRSPLPEREAAHLGDAIAGPRITPFFLPP